VRGEDVQFTEHTDIFDDMPDPQVTWRIRDFAGIPRCLEGDS
jgi:hypothetical protein